MNDDKQLKNENLKNVNGGSITRADVNGGAVYNQASENDGAGIGGSNNEGYIKPIN